MITIFDVRGLIIQSLHSGTDREGTTTPKGKKLNSVGHCVDTFIDWFLLPATEYSRLNDIIAVEDSGNAYREEILPSYKAHRKSAEPELTERINECTKTVLSLLKGLGIPSAHVKGVEADDVIAYLVEKLPHSKLIYTVDQDLIQLANDRCGVFVKGIPARSYKVYGSGKPKPLLMEVMPRHLALYKSIVGDTSDGYSGVKNLGSSKFYSLFKDFGEDGLDELCHIVSSEDYLFLDSVVEQTKHPVLRTLSEYRLDWRKSWRLAKLMPELVEAKSVNTFNRLLWDDAVPSRSLVEKVLEGCNCLHRLADFEAFLPTQELITQDNIDQLPFDLIGEEMKASPFVSIDWETTDKVNNPAFKIASKGKEFVDMLSSTITGAGFTFGKNLQHTLYFSFDHANTNNLDRQILLDLLDKIPVDKPVIIQNALFELNVLKNTLGRTIPVFYDTKVMASYVDENEPSGLKECSKRYLNYNQIKYREVVPEGKTMSDVTAEQVFQYGADDPLVTAHLFDHYKRILELENTWEFCRTNEFPTIRLLSDAFLAGVSIDWEALADQTEEDQAIFDRSMARLREIIEAHQTSAMIESGVARLFEESKLDIEQNARRVALKKGEDKDEVTENMLSKFEEELYETVKYKPFIEIREEKKIDFNISTLRTILTGLGFPRLNDIKDLRSYIREVRVTFRELLETQEELQVFLEILSLLIEERKPENHPMFLEFQKFCRIQHPDLFTSFKKEGSELSLNSPKQMKILLYGMLDLPIRIREFEVSKTRKKLGLTNTLAQANYDAIVTALAEDCADYPWKKEALEALLEARRVLTRISMYYKPYPNWVYPQDGLIHPQFNSCGTETRRPSGSAPNLLQLSKKGEGVKIRRCILPNQKLNHDLVVSIDWSAQELRVIAGLSKDPEMVACYVGDNLLDIHSLTASQIMKKPYEEFMQGLKSENNHEFKQARSRAKTTTFLSAYGGGAGKLARSLIVSQEDAQGFLEAKKLAFPVVEEWREQSNNFLKFLGYAKTLFGNRKHVFDRLYVGDNNLVKYQERSSFNFQIQGCCADYLKKVLTDIVSKRIFERYNAVLIAPIYDELVISCHSSQAVGLIKEVYAVMVQGIPGLGIPMLANPALGVNFGDQIEILDDENDILTDDKILIAIDKAFGRELKEVA